MCRAKMAAGVLSSALLSPNSTRDRWRRPEVGTRSERFSVRPLGLLSRAISSVAPVFRCSVLAPNLGKSGPQNVGLAPHLVIGPGVVAYAQ